jgi:hypothetical protein
MHKASTRTIWCLYIFYSKKGLKQSSILPQDFDHSSIKKNLGLEFREQKICKNKKSKDIFSLRQNKIITEK